MNLQRKGKIKDLERKLQELDSRYERQGRELLGVAFIKPLGLYKIRETKAELAKLQRKSSVLRRKLQRLQYKDRPWLEDQERSAK